VVTNAAMLLINLLFVIVFFKELKITSFDPALATTIGINANLMQYVLMTLVAATTIAAFESVGSILVIAMLIVPGAAAHLLTDRLAAMLVISLVFAAASAFFGHLGAITIPTWFGFEDTSTAGMMATMAGFLFGVVLLLAPRYGLISRFIVQLRLGTKIVGDDILGFLYRYQELAADEAAPVTVAQVKAALKAGFAVDFSLWGLLRRRMVHKGDGRIKLTAEGLTAGRSLVRSHRLWETYLCDKMGYCSTHVHEHAHQLEHYTDDDLQRQLGDVTGNPVHDPHHRKIPAS
jgi:manganese/zinc/iron transport system permease protein